MTNAVRPVTSATVSRATRVETVLENWVFKISRNAAVTKAELLGNLCLGSPIHTFGPFRVLWQQWQQWLHDFSLGKSCGISTRKKAACFRSSSRATCSSWKQPFLEVLVAIKRSNFVQTITVSPLASRVVTVVSRSSSPGKFCRQCFDFAVGNSAVLVPSSAGLACTVSYQENSL